ncbi:MAG: hypothetical protein MJE77_19870 [Proteobacteria bacterium]|nr:hypothetical protein [Pseudomonadota bacterium]
MWRKGFVVTIAVRAWRSSRALLAGDGCRPGEHACERASIVSALGELNRDPPAGSGSIGARW